MICQCQSVSDLSCNVSHRFGFHHFLKIRTASNTFFYQFPNCLPYSDLEEGLEKLEWALENDPRPLSKETIHKLSWEGANDRLFEASAISKDELDEWQETGKIKDDEDAARFHVDTAMKGQLVQKYFGGVFRNGEPTEVTTEAQSKTS